MCTSKDRIICTPEKKKGAHLSAHAGNLEFYS